MQHLFESRGFDSLVVILFAFRFCARRRPLESCSLWVMGVQQIMWVELFLVLSVLFFLLGLLYVHYILSRVRKACKGFVSGS